SPAPPPWATPSAPRLLGLLPAAALRRHPCACAASVPTASRPASHGSPRPLAPKPLEERRRPVRFAPIWPAVPGAAPIRAVPCVSDHPLRVPPCPAAATPCRTTGPRERRPRRSPQR